MATNIRSDCNGLGGVGYHSSISVTMFTTPRRQVWHEFEQLISTAIRNSVFHLSSLQWARLIHPWLCTHH